ncbi:MAG: transcriptional repressor [Planctomycetes bacterium]|nr:transcriptional repressor [Planctomycetota bacterium]
MGTDPPDSRIACFERLCRQRRLPLTPQRRAVLRFVVEREDHPTADQVCEAVRPQLPGISRASVYRVLDMLVRIGMLTKVCHPGSAVRFDPRVGRHHHLVCLQCERIIDVEDPRLNRVPLPDVRGRGFQINDYHIHFRGICAACLGKKNTRARTTRPVGRPRAGHRTGPTNRSR